MTALGHDSDPRPEPPMYSVIDATGWTADELAEQQYLDDEADEQYRADLAAWEERNGSIRDAIEASGIPSGRRSITVGA